MIQRGLLAMKISLPSISWQYELPGICERWGDRELDAAVAQWRYGRGVSSVELGGVYFSTPAGNIRCILIKSHVLGNNTLKYE